MLAEWVDEVADTDSRAHTASQPVSCPNHPVCVVVNGSVLASLRVVSALGR
jgi:hypothetical protein